MYYYYNVLYFIVLMYVCMCVCTVHRQSGEFFARGSRRGEQRFRRVPVRSGPHFHGHGAKLENGNDKLRASRALKRNEKNFFFFFKLKI